MANVRRALLALLVCLVFIRAAHAGAGTPVPVAQWQHTVFTAKDGAPAEVRAMAQDRAGFLWFGGSTGLYRFDGVTFDGSVSARLPHRAIMTLYGARDGSLWIGDRRGYVTRLKDGHVTDFDVEPERATVMYITELPDGSLWAVSTRGAYVFDGERWQRLALGTPPDTRLIQALAGRDGALWIVSEDRAWRVAPRTHAITHRRIEEAYGALLADPGPAWRQPDNVLSDSVLDSEGAVWMGTTRGILRAWWTEGDAAAGPRLETYGKRDGLGGTQAVAAVGDREGNVWIATPGTIEQFRLGTFRRQALPDDAMLPSIAVDGHGVLWDGRMDGTVSSHGAEARSWPGSLRHVTAAATALDGSILMAGEDGVLRFDAQGATAVPFQVPGHGATHRYIGVAQAHDGSVWALAGMAYRYANGTTRSLGADAGLPGSPHVALSIARRADHGLWIGYSGNALARLEDDGSGVSVMDAADGIAVGQVFALWPQAHGTWIAGQEGVQFVGPGKRVLTLRVRADMPLRDATGIVEEGDGSLWINMVHGLYRVAPGALAAWRMAPDTAVDAERFDERDGLPGVRDERPAPSLVPGSGGTLWIASDAGIASIDTARIVRNMVAPDAMVLRVNGQPVHMLQTLPAGTRRVEIDYAAPVLGVPGRARFARRLDGLDSGWQDAGNERRVTYANLAPGDYRFSVKAANEDGLWSPRAASVSLRIAPFFWQTAWFRVAVALLALGLLYLAWRWRLRTLGILICARLLERERIARELHDTVLQSLQGVLLRVKLAADAVHDASARTKLEAAMRATQDALVEGRNRIVGLRGTRGDASTLPDRLVTWAAALEGGDRVTVAVAVSGVPRALNPSADDDIEAIVFELVGNAVRHAAASQVEVHLHFGRRRFQVDVMDDGRGMQAVRDTPDRPSFGMVGMRERAQKLASRLRIEARSPRGTHAMLRVPGPVAYWLPERTVARLRSRPWFR